MPECDKYLQKTDELRNLLNENPDLPLLIFTRSDPMNRTHTFYRAEVGEILRGCDCPGSGLIKDIIYKDRNEVEETIAYWACYSREAMTEEEVEQEVHKYDDLWKKCIILHVDY